MKRKIVFLTGTRADFGKLKSLIEILQTEHGENLFERAVAGELQNLGITSGSAIDKFFANFKTSKMEEGN